MFRNKWRFPNVAQTLPRRSLPDVTIATLMMLCMFIFQCYILLSEMIYRCIFSPNFMIINNICQTLWLLSRNFPNIPHSYSISYSLTKEVVNHAIIICQTISPACPNLIELLSKKINRFEYYKEYNVVWDTTSTVNRRLLPKTSQISIIVFLHLLPILNSE